MNRQTAVAGQFYPASCEEITDQIARFNHLLDTHLEDKSLLGQKARMIIVPHAGYIYSGFTANIAHRILGASDAKRVIVIGPSHRVYIPGASIALYNAYDTPCGSLPIDRDYAKKIQKKHALWFQENAHSEHSTETQLPFIKHYLPQASVCEIIYGEMEYQTVSQIIVEALQEPDTVVVISTDLSHFYQLDQAKKLDYECLSAIENLNLDLLLNGACEACGKIGVLGALDAAKQLGYKATLLDYRTSADVTRDKQSVVGYVSAIFN